MKKLIILSIAFVFSVSVGFALKPVPVVTTSKKAETTVTPTTPTKTPAAPPKASPTAVSKATTLSKVGTDSDMPELEAEDLPAPGTTTVLTTPTTTPGKTTNTTTPRVVPGSTKSVPTKTVGGGPVVEKDNAKGNAVPIEENEEPGFLAPPTKQETKTTLKTTLKTPSKI